MRAEPASHGFGISSGVSPWCSARKCRRLVRLRGHGRDATPSAGRSRRRPVPNAGLDVSQREQPCRDSRARSRSSPAAVRASAARPRCCSRPKARRSPSPTSRPTRRDASSTRSKPRADGTRASGRRRRRRPRSRRWSPTPSPRSAGSTCLHNNAAALDQNRLDQDVATMDLATWDRVLDVNLTGPMLGCRFAIPAMLERGGGSIVNTASAAAFYGSHSLAAYGTSKAGPRRAHALRRDRVRRTRDPLQRGCARRRRRPATRRLRSAARWATACAATARAT